MKYLITYYYDGSSREVWTDDYNIAWELQMALEAFSKIERVVIQERQEGWRTIHDTKPKKQGL